MPRAWLIASLVALAYFATSLVVALNSLGNATGVVWLPSFPAWYYAVARALYWPFQPYFWALRPLQESPAVSFATYAAISRAPFLVAPVVVWLVTAARWRRGRRWGAGPVIVRGVDLMETATQWHRGGPHRERVAPRRWRPSGRAALLALLAIGLALYALVPAVRGAVNGGIAALDPRDIGRLRDYLLGFGAWAPVVSFALMVLQSVAAPLPAFVITLANGLLFGAFWGAVLSWSSAMAGAALCYGIARALGRPAVERLVGAGPLAKTDAFFERYGSHAVLIARLIPIISFDLVSYGAGLTTIRFLPFMVATGVGQLPATIVYSVLGEHITAASRAGLWAAGALLSLLVLGVALRERLERRIAGRVAQTGAQTGTHTGAPSEARAEARPTALPT